MSGSSELPDAITKQAAAIADKFRADVKAAHDRYKETGDPSAVHALLVDDAPVYTPLPASAVGIVPGIQPEVRPPALLPLVSRILAGDPELMTEASLRSGARTYILPAQERSIRESEFARMGAAPNAPVDVRKAVRTSRQSGKGPVDRPRNP